MRLKEFLLAEINREIDRSRRALEQAPADKYDWKPHEKSMVFGYLAYMVVTIPMWITMEINEDELDLLRWEAGRWSESVWTPAKNWCRPSTRPQSTHRW